MLTKMEPTTLPLDEGRNKYVNDANFRIIPFDHKEITGWSDYTPDPGTDALRISGNGFAYISNCVFGRKGLNPKQADELASVVNGGDIVFYRCRFADNGKAFLQGSGDTNMADLRKGQRVMFVECIFENCGRRSPFAQIGQTYMINCYIKNWGKSFHEKSYGCRAGTWGQLTVSHCVFEQESFWTCIRRWHTLEDMFRQYLYPLFFLPGFMRGAYADYRGHVACYNCYKNRWWIRLENHFGKMPIDEANELIEHLENVVPNYSD